MESTNQEESKNPALKQEYGDETDHSEFLPKETKPIKFGTGGNTKDNKKRKHKVNVSDRTERLKFWSRIISIRGLNQCLKNQYTSDNYKEDSKYAKDYNFKPDTDPDYIAFRKYAATKARAVADDNSNRYSILAPAGDTLASVDMEILKEYFTQV